MIIKLKDTKNLRRSLLVSGLNQKEFAKRIGVSEPYVSLLLRGIKSPGPRVATNILRVVGVDFDDLFYIIE